MIGTNLYEFIPQTPLEFQEGDIFGFYFPHRDQSSLNIYEQDGNGPLNRRVTPNSLLPATIAEELASVSNDFVLVTVEISSRFMCNRTYVHVFLVSTSSSVISISSYEVSTNIINSMIISATPMISMNASLTSVISLISTTPISSFVTSAALSNLPVTSIATVTGNVVI